jgi:hypothetical protein
VFEAIEEEDRVVENDDGVNPALLGSCNDRAKQLHASPSGLPLNVLVNQCFKYVCGSQSLSLMHCQNRRRERGRPERERERPVSNAATHIHLFSHILTCRNRYYCSEIFQKDKG